MPKVKSSDWIRNYCVGKEPVIVMNMEEQEITFAAATTGAQAAKELFQVTGLVLCTVIGVCTTTLTGTSATICVGTASDTNLIIAASTVTSIDAGDVFVDATAIGETEEQFNTITWILTNGNDIAYEVETANIDTGVIKFYCLWYGLSDDAMVVPSGVNTATS